MSAEMELHMGQGRNPALSERRAPPEQRVVGAQSRKGRGRGFEPRLPALWDFATYEVAAPSPCGLTLRLRLRAKRGKSGLRPTTRP